jgi:hypothetical protein
MKIRESQLWWFGAGVVVAVVIASQLWRLPDAESRIAQLPAGGIWHRTAPVELLPWERTFFGRAKVTKRIAVVRQERVVLTVVDGSLNRQAVHDPEFCFRGAGWTVASSAPLDLLHGRARLLQLRKGDITAEAVFWFSDGTEAFAEPWRYWAATTLRRLTFGKSGPEPVLVLLTSLDATAPKWNALLERWPDLARL